MRDPLALTVAIVALAGVVAACTGNAAEWTSADAKSATDALHSQALLVTSCGGDAGCSPAVLRAVERSSVCNLAAMLHRHGADVPEAGAECQP